jgi:hypothetical protein
MIRSLLIISLLTIVIAACEKNKFETTPKIKVKTSSTGVLPQNDSLIIRFEFTDKEGDIDSLVMLRNRLNKRGILNNLRGPYLLPNFPATSKGEIELVADYNFALTFGVGPLKIPGSVPDKFEPDSMKLRFYAVDRAGNRSDTVDLDLIIIR